MSLSALPGELQDHIILALSPSSAIALSRTNHHFQTTSSLFRLPSSSVDAFLDSRSAQILDKPNYLCRSCLLFKPKRAFTLPHVRGSRCKTGRDAHKRSCLQCLIENGIVLPGQVLEMADAKSAGGRRVWCFACLELKERFCMRCNWCDGCARARKVRTFRKGWMGSGGRGDGMGWVINCCSPHLWSEVGKVKGLGVREWEDEDGFGDK